MFFATVEGCTYNVWVNAIFGNYLTAVALHLGAGGFSLGVLGALPHVATMLQLVSAPFVVGLRRRRLFIACFTGVQRLGAPLIGLLGLYLFPLPIALPLFVALHVVAWMFMAPPTVVWQGYMTDLVPEHIRGRYFAMRSAVCFAVAMVAVLGYGWLLDWLPGEPGFRLMFLIAFGAGLLNFGSWFLHPELPPGEQRSARPFWEVLRGPLQNRTPHRTAALFFGVWGFAQGMSVPFFPLALQQTFGLSFSAISLLTTATTLTAILSSRFWGRLQDRFGEEMAISVQTLLMATVPALFVLGNVGGIAAIGLAHLVLGGAQAGLNLASMTLNMRLAPLEDRSSYFAFFAAVGGTAGFLTPVLVGPMTTLYLMPLFAVSAVASALLVAYWHYRLRPRLRA